MIPLGNSLTRRDIASVLHPYTNLRDHQKKGPLIITRGRGVHVYDDDGKEYIEGLAGLWCASLGFSEPRLTEAAQRQIEADQASGKMRPGSAMILSRRFLC